MVIGYKKPQQNSILLWFFCASALWTRLQIHDLGRGIIYDPANDVPKMPTASSIQMSTSTIRIIAQRTIRCLVLVTFLIINSHITTVPSNRTPAAIKSVRVQFTSSVNCIAINGMSNRIVTMSKIPINLLVFIIINL
jgi:hypothetical protein